jgi:hypothetical protein
MTGQNEGHPALNVAIELDYTKSNGDQNKIVYVQG